MTLPRSVYLRLSDWLRIKSSEFIFPCHFENSSNPSILVTKRWMFQSQWQGACVFSLLLCQFVLLNSVFHMLRCKKENSSSSCSNIPDDKGTKRQQRHHFNIRHGNCLHCRAVCMCSRFDCGCVFIFQARKGKFLITAGPCGSSCKGMKGFYSNTHAHRHPRTWKQRTSAFWGWPQCCTNGTVTSSSALRQLESVASGRRVLTPPAELGIQTGNHNIKSLNGLTLRLLNKVLLVFMDGKHNLLAKFMDQFIGK